MKDSEYYARFGCKYGHTWVKTSGFRVDRDRNDNREVCSVRCASCGAKTWMDEQEWSDPQNGFMGVKDD